jgi:NADPH-dependent curcumin reductase CurA
VEDGLENAVEAVGRLFSGDHDGKLLLRVSPEP